MNFKRIRNWLQNRNWKGAPKRLEQLREFVYLDETSVYSLLASRGPIAVEFTKTEQETLAAEARGEIGANFGVGNATASSTFSGNRTHGTQILRRSIAQSSFRDLFESEQESLTIGPVSHVEIPVVGSDWKAWAGSNAAKHWALPVSALKRGQLFDVEVELEAEEVFRVGAVVSSTLELIDKNSAMFGSVEQEGLRTGRGVAKLLEILLDGLVPLRGKVVDYQLVYVDGAPWVVHVDIIRQLKSLEILSPADIFVVGVTDERMFWKDLRRILFASLRYRVFCRLAADGVSDHWTPVKLAHVMRGVLPDLGEKIQDASRMALSGLAVGGGLNPSEQEQQARIIDAIQQYGSLAHKRYGWTNARPVEELNVLASKVLPQEFLDFRKRRDLFGQVDAILAKASGMAIGADVAVGLRMSAMLEAGLWVDGQSLPFAGPSAAAPLPEKPRRHYLDAEFVAIYW